jgi:hypothetical protein
LGEKVAAGGVKTASQESANEKKNFFYEKKKQKHITNCFQQAFRKGQLDAVRNR